MSEFPFSTRCFPAWAVLCTFVLSAVSLYAAGPSRVKDVDAVVRRGDVLYLFRYSPWLGLRIGLSDTAADLTARDWRPMVRPSGGFTVRQVTGGPFGNFLVLDIFSRKIWQLDSGLQVLSSLKVPDDIEDAQLPEYRMYWTEDRRITFVNVSQGKFFQFIESAGSLRLLFRGNIPLSCRALVHARPPYAGREFRDYGFWCTAEKGVDVFNTSFSGKIALLRDSLPVSRFRSGFPPADEPALSLDASGRPVLRFGSERGAFCFNPEPGEFYSCP